MNRLITKLDEVLNFVKGFDTMWDSRKPNKMIIKHNGIAYLVKVEEIPNYDSTKDCINYL